MTDITNNKREIPRAIPSTKESLTVVDLHMFGDASIVAYCMEVYATVYQSTRVNQGLLVSKSCISKKNLILPGLDLVPAHMASNLVCDAVLAVNTGKIDQL